MLELPPSLPSAVDYLPNWSTSRIVVLEKSGRWTPAIAAEVHQRLDKTHQQAGQTLVFERCSSARDAIFLSELRNSRGLVLFLKGLERECLGVLSRLARLPLKRPILVIAENVHRDLLPVLLEGGADTVLFNVRDDVPIADWCLRCRSQKQP